MWNTIKQYDFVILSILIYIFVLVTSFFHTVFFLSSFEPQTQQWIAIFIALALDVSLFYFVFAETVQRLRGIKTRDSKIAYISLTLVVFFANWISMAYHFDPTKYPWQVFGFKISTIFPFISSIYIPFTTIYLAKVGASFIHASSRRKINQKLTKTEFEFVRQQLKKDPTTTVKEMQKLFRNEFNKTISKSSIYRIRKELDERK